MSNTTSADSGAGRIEAEVATALNQWITDHEPLSRAAFDHINRALIQNVGITVDHPTWGRNVQCRDADAEAFSQFAYEHDIPLIELDEDARYGDLHGYPVVGGIGWVPVLVTTDDSGSVTEAARRIHESYQAIGNTVPADFVNDGKILTDGGTARADTEPATDINTDALVGLAANEEELSWRYKTALAPHNFNSEPAGHVVIDEDYYSQTLVVRDWPDRPVYGFLDNLISFTMPSVETTVTTHFTGEDDRDAERELSNAAGSVKDMVRDYAASKWIPEYFVEKAAEMYGSIKRTQKTVRQSEYGLYTSQTYIEVRAPSTDHLDTAVSLIRSKMQSVNADAVPLKYDHDLGYQTAAPACKDYIGGETKMVGDGLSRLVPWTAQNLIEPGGIELGINEDTGDPIILDLWNRETGFNIGIWGTIGGGKTTTMTRTMTRSKMQYPEIPQVIIDPRQEFDGYAEAFGGKRLVIGSETGINPFMIEPISEEKRDELGEKAPLRKAKRRGMRFLESYYNFMGLPFEDKQGLWRDVVDVGFERREITEDPATHHYDNPTLADDFIPILEEAANSPQKFLRESLKDSDYAKGRVKKVATNILQNDVNALEEGGEFEHLAKETTVDIADIDVLVLDLQNYENDAAAGLVMEPLLVAILEQAKSSDEPMQLGIDEFHYMFHNTTSIETLKRAYRYSRHSTLSVITSTQTVSEFYTENESGVKQLTDSAKELISMMSVKIFHYSDEMDKELAGEFDMSEAEYSYHKDASTGDPTAQALLQVEKEGSFKLDVNFDDELNPREFALNQYDPTDDGYGLYEYLANYTDADGEDPCEWTWEIPIDGNGETGQSADIAEDGQVSEKGQLDNYSSPDIVIDSDTDTDGNADTDTGSERSSSGDGDESQGVPPRMPRSGFESDGQVREGESTEAETTKSETEMDADPPPTSESESEPELEPDYEKEQEQDTTTDDPSDKPTATVEFTSDDEDAIETADSDADDQSAEKQSYWGRIKKSVSSSFAHPAAGKTDPDLTDIGMVDKGRAAALRDAGFETVVAIYTADTGALAEVEGVADETFAEVIQDGAKQALDVSDAPVPPTAMDDTANASESEDETETESDHESEGEVEAEQQSSSTGVTRPVLTDIQQVGEDRAGDLRAEGYESVEDVATVGQDTLTEVEGVGGARAETMVESANDLLNEQPGDTVTDATGDD